MRKKFASISMGVFIILIGLLFLGKAFGLVDNILFKGWWTLFIILPSVYSIISIGIRWHNLFMLCLGSLLLLKTNGYIEDVDLGYLIISFILLSVGISFFTRSNGEQGSFYNKKYSQKNLKSDEYIDVVEVFSGCEKKYISNTFKGGSIITIFGGAEVDLSEVNIQETVVIKCIAIFGGIDIMIPDNYRVKEEVTNIFGGTDIHYAKNRKQAQVYTDDNKVIVINGISIFGGIDVYQ